MSDKHFCPTCGLEYRLWVEKLERKVCDQCDPKEFKELHKENVRQHKKRFVGQQHITENTFFPRHASGSVAYGYKKYRRQQK